MSSRPPSDEQVLRGVTRFGLHIAQIGEFKTCLDTVRFPKGFKDYENVIWVVTELGVTLKSKDKRGIMMTRTLIKRAFFKNYLYEGADK